MVFAACCESERLWGSAGTSEPPRSAYGERRGEERREEVSLGEGFASSMSHYAVVLSGGGVRDSQQTLSASLSSLGRWVETGSMVVVLGFPSLLCMSGCIRASLLRYFCCVQDHHLRRASGFWCY